MHTVDTTVTIDAPPAAVWRVLTDFDRSLNQRAEAVAPEP